MTRPGEGNYLFTDWSGGTLLSLQALGASVAEETGRTTLPLVAWVSLVHTGQGTQVHGVNVVHRWNRQESVKSLQNNESLFFFLGGGGGGGGGGGKMGNCEVHIASLDLRNRKSESRRNTVFLFKQALLKKKKSFFIHYFYLSVTTSSLRRINLFVKPKNVRTS